jgi:acid stress-induced BolA-like protein IbaG/YrbA
VTCVSDIFSGKNAVQRQRMVYKALWEELERDVHAVDSIVALTVDEAKSKGMK